MFSISKYHFYVGVSLTISHTSERWPLVCVSVLILENWHLYFIFKKGRDGHGVAIALCHFVRVQNWATLQMSLLVLTTNWGKF